MTIFNRISFIKESETDGILKLLSDLKDVKELNEPFLGLRDKGWLTLEDCETLQIIALPDDGGRCYIRIV